MFDQRSVAIVSWMEEASQRVRLLVMLENLNCVMGLLESDFPKNRAWNSAAEKSVAGHESSLILHATADERSGGHWFS